MPNARDAWYAVERREAPDLGGKVVDIHALPELGYGFLYDLESALPREDLIEEVLARLRLLRDAKAKVIRERRFNVWYGTAPTPHGKPVAAVLFPDRFDSRAWRLLADLRRLPGSLEQTSAPVRDLTGGPLARYDHGHIAGYTDPVSPPNNPDSDVELRSAVVVIPTTARPREWMLPPNGRSPRLHSLRSWAENRERILAFIWQLKAAGTYKRLRELAEDRFGIRVLEEEVSASTSYGRLRLGWPRGDDASVPVAIFVRGDLPTELKYVVLAHELGHYTLHFPVLHLGAVTDDMARAVPELGLVFGSAIKEHLDPELLEDQADHLASNMLIPPRYDLARFAEHYFEVGNFVAAEEYAWRFLRPLFPDTTERIGWSNYKLMAARARADLETAADSPDSLFSRMLRAMVLRLKERAEPVDQQFANGFEKVRAELDDALGIAAGTDLESVRNALASQYRRSDVASLPDDVVGDRYEVLRPRADLTGRLPQSVHLVPAANNPAALDSGLWVDRHHPETERAPLADWPKLVGDDVALRVYRHESWQIGQQTP